MKVREQDDLQRIIVIIFDFIKNGRIHSFTDHMSDYSPVKELFLDAELTLFRYNRRLDSYSLFFRNPANHLVDIVLLFSFGATEFQQIMVNLQNESLYLELAFSGLGGLLPLMKYQEKKPHKQFTLFKKKTIEEKIITLDEFETFLEKNRVQKGRGYSKLKG